MTEEAYISVDIEASGNVAGLYSMVSLGASLCGTDKSFYVEIKPLLGSKMNPKAMSIHGLTEEYLAENGTPARIAMREFRSWVNEVSKGRKPTLVVFNSWDSGWINYYFGLLEEEDERDKYSNPFSSSSNPFFIRCVDIKSMYMGLRKIYYNKTKKGSMPKSDRVRSTNAHNGEADAIAQARMFEMLMNEMGLSI